MLNNWAASLKHTMLHIFKYLMERGRRLIKAPDEPFEIIASVDPNIWIIMQPKRQELIQLMPTTESPSAVKALSSNQTNILDLSPGRMDTSVPGSGRIDQYREEQRLALEREGHEKFAAVNEATHKPHIAANTQALGTEHGQTMQVHPLLGEDPRFAGIEANVSPLPTQNEFAEENRQRLENVLHPKPGFNPNPFPDHKSP